MLNENTRFILLYNVRRDLATSSFQSFVSDFFEPESHAVVHSSLQL